MPFVIGFIGFNLFALLSPFLLIAAALWGSPDDQQFMRVAFWVAFPFTVCLWYFILRMFTAFWRGFFEGFRRG